MRAIPAVAISRVFLILAVAWAAPGCGKKAGPADGGSDASAQMDNPYVPRNIGPPPAPGGDGGSGIVVTATSFRCVMTAAEDVPAWPSFVSESGEIDFKLDPQTLLLTATIKHNVPLFAIAHVHVGPPGATGKVIFSLTEPRSGTSWTLKPTVDEINSLQKGEFYCDLHQKADDSDPSFIRGQLLNAGEELFTANLTGALADNPHVSSTTGYFALVLNPGSLGYRYQMTPSAAAKSVDLVDLQGHSQLSVGLSMKDANGVVANSGTLTVAQVQAIEAGLYTVKMVMNDTGEEVAGVLASPGSTLYVATPNGSEVQPTPVTTTDTASVRFVVDYLQTEALYSIDAPATASDVVLEEAGLPNPTPLAQFAGGASTGTLSSVTDAAKLTPALQAIINGQAFVSVATASNPTGELQGQVRLPGETLFVAKLSGDEMNHPMTVASAGMAWVLLSLDGASARYYVATSGLPNNAASLILDEAMATAPAGMYASGTTFWKAAQPVSVAMTGTMDFSKLSFGGEAFQARLARLHIEDRAQNWELVGQLRQPGEALYVARLFGSNVVPNVTTWGSGLAQAVVDAAGNAVSINVQANTDSTQTQAWLCRSPGGVAAPVTQCSTISAAANGILSFMQQGVSLDAAGEKAFERGLQYVQIATSQYPDGDLRGQFVRPGEQIYATTLSALNEVPQTTSAATGGLQVILSAPNSQDANTVRYDGLLVMEDSQAVARLAIAGFGQSPDLTQLPLSLQIPEGGTGIIQGDMQSMQGQYLNALQNQQLSVLVSSSDPRYQYPKSEIRGTLLPAN